MKRFAFLSIRILCLAIAGVLFVACSASATLPPRGYIGIFTDATHDIGMPDHNGQYTGGSGYNVCPAQYTQFHAWIWCLPSMNGLKAAEFAVGFPLTTYLLAQVKNPAITVEIGTLAEGISVEFGECQMDWTYLYTLQMLQLGSQMLAAQISIIPRPGPPPAPTWFAPCPTGYPGELYIYLTPLYICYPNGPDCLCPIGIEKTSWGAIKNLF